MNARIRQHGLSARELWTQRDQLTGEQLPVDDRQVIIQQYQSRIINHPHSAHSKAPKRISSSSPDLKIGYLVYLRSERDKTKPRCKYMICSIADKHCYLSKFTKSQFHSKSYKVPLSECYPIQGTTLSQTPPGPIRGIDQSENEESESDSEQFDYTANEPDLSSRTSALIPPAPRSCVDSTDSVHPPLELITPAELPSAVPSCETPPPCRSSRLNKGQPPVWLDNEDWKR